MIYFLYWLITYWFLPGFVGGIILLALDYWAPYEEAQVKVKDIVRVMSASTLLGSVALGAILVEVLHRNFETQFYKFWNFVVYTDKPKAQDDRNDE